MIYVFFFCFCNCRFLNNAEIAPHVSGANYTFFVPDDKAFEKLGFDKLSDDVMVSLYLFIFNWVCAKSVYI